MAAGVAFFDPGFQGDETAALLEGMAKRCGLRLRAWLTPQDIQARFFDPYNAEVPDFRMYAPPDVAYCVLERV